MDANRARRTRRCHVETLAADQLVDSADATADCEQLHAREILRKALCRLEHSWPGPALELFDRLFLREQSPAEIASEMSMQLEAVYQWKCRLRTRLKSSIAVLSGARGRRGESAGP